MKETMVSLSGCRKKTFPLFKAHHLPISVIFQEKFAYLEKVFAFRLNTEQRI